MTHVIKKMNRTEGRRQQRKSKRSLFALFPLCELFFHFSKENSRKTKLLCFVQNNLNELGKQVLKNVSLSNFNLCEISAFSFLCGKILVSILKFYQTYRLSLCFYPDSCILRVSKHRLTFYL